MDEEAKGYKLLLVDDEPDILEFLSYALRREGYEVYAASDGDSGLKTALAELPHLILLDVMMPNKDGIETCEEMRKHRELDATLIAFLTARAEDYSQIAGFEAGADDYISKPIKPKLLITRIKALLKRLKSEGSEPETESPQTDIAIDIESYVLIKDGKRITLPRKEFELLALLMSKPEKVFERDEIFRTVWGSDLLVGDRTIDVHIRKLREKIGDKHIKTLKGVGYKFVYNE